MRKLYSFPGGLKLPGFKAQSSAHPCLPPILPERLIFPLNQHIGTPSEPLVKVGDQVLKGQVIAKSSSYVSAAIHASSSGEVIAVDQAITIETDGSDRWCEKMASLDPAHTSAEILEKRIVDAGVIGMGGAGFPSQVKIIEGANAQVETLLINGVECEPYITCDDRLMRERAIEIVNGAKILQDIVTANTCVLAVEADMPEAYQALLAVALEGQEVVLVPAIYPAGGERQLIQTLTGKQVPSHGLPIQLGVLVQNVATVAAIYRAVVHGEPLISRIVTVAGEIKNPCNIEVLNGTPVCELLASMGNDVEATEQILIGGPMMGTELSGKSSPVLKKTSCLLLRTKKKQEVESACIRCGDCVDVCPVKLQPQMLLALANAKHWEEIQDYRLFECIECGCCDYVCPSHIPLVKHYKGAKISIQQQDDVMQRASLSRDRHLSRMERELSNEQEQAEDRKKKRDSRLKKDNLQNEVLAAVERTRAKKNSLKK